MVLRMNQLKTPVFDAVKRYVESNVIQFHVPVTSRSWSEELREYIGETALKMDANGMEDLDFANNPTGVIYESEMLAAQAFGAQHAYFLVNGTTSGVQAMIMSTCEPGDK